MKKKKSFFSLFLVCLLVFSNLAYAGPVGAAASSEKLPLENLTEEIYNPNDVVRIVVELEQEPAIEYATSQGVLYKELDNNLQKQLEEAIVNEQLSVQDAITSANITFEVEHNFTVAFNGFSGLVTFDEIEVIESLPGVLAVHIANEYFLPELETANPNMEFSHNMIGTELTWEEVGLTGEGMIVGIIDTGIDPSHADLTPGLDEGVEIALTEDLVNSLKDEHKLPGVFFTDKVPYGYNYMDKNTQILETGPSVSSHGMHVAGTVASNGHLLGVAPNAQLLALKVFGNDPRFGSTYGDIYTAAIDDAIKLGADVINLSLGSPAAFNNPNNPEQMAITRAVENGMIAAISAGNSNNFTTALTGGLPLATNPDIGVVGAPSLTPASTSVASVDNATVVLEEMLYVAGEVEGSIGMSPSNKHHLNLDGPKELVHVTYTGSGDEGLASLRANLATADVEGKIVLLQRGLTFVDKTMAIQEAGGVGAIVYNHSPGYTTMPTEQRITIPQMFISKNDGELLAELVTTETVTLSFNGANKEVMLPYTMSAFTSWGLTPDLDFKPEITAPGGSINSLLQGGGYGVKSGTSMAAPHLAGGAALILERVDVDFGLTGNERSIRAKNLLLNTAAPVIQDGYGIPVSPRRQGAGLMDVYGAATTPVIVTEVNSGEGKVALKEVGDTFTFTLKAENFSDEDVTYGVSTNAQTDLVNAAGRIQLVPQTINGVEVSYAGIADNSITVPANGSVEFTVTVDVTNGLIDGGKSLVEVFPNGNFVEGFVSLTDANNDLPTLTVPYVGFYGKWDKAPVIDKKRFEEGRYLSNTDLYTNDREDVLRLSELTVGDKAVENIHVFSPVAGNGLNPVLTLLRNAKELQYNILDADQKYLRTVLIEKNIRKSYASPGHNFTSSGIRTWDGTVKGNVVPDGLYYYEIKAVIDFPGAEWQSVLFPVLVDATAPAVEFDYDKEDGTVEWSVSDHGSGLSEEVRVYVNGVVQETIAVTDENRSEVTGSLDVSDLVAGSSVAVVAADRAGNAGSGSLEGINDHRFPFIYIDSPEALGIYNTLEIPVSGYILDQSNVVELKVNGNVTEVTFNETANRFEFDTTVTFEKDGAPDVFFDITDAAGNTVGIKRQIIVDTKAPTLNVTAPASVNANTSSVEVTVSVADNFDSLRLFVDQSQKYLNLLSAPYGETNFKDEFKLTLELEPGENVFVFELVDGAGNVTEKEVKINRGTASTPPPAGGGGGGGYTPAPTPPVVPAPELPAVKTFSDITNHWAKAEIEFLATRSIINGKTETTFAPNADITRAEFAALVARVLELEKGTFKGTFSDVSATAWYAKEVEAAQAEGIVQGSAGKFNPNSKITREEMAVMIVRAYEFKAKETVTVDGELQFADKAAVSAWATSAVHAANSLGIVNGKTATTFAPQDQATRAEAATMLYRLIQKF